MDTFAKSRGSRDRLPWLGVTIAMVCAAVCVFNWGKLSGRQYGYFYGVFEAPQSLFGDGPDHFSRMNVWYFYIVCSLSAYVLAGSLARWRASAILRIALLSICLFPFIEMLLYKTETYGMGSFYYHYYGLKASYFMDWMCVIFILIIMVSEIMIFRSCATKRPLIVSAINC